MVAKTHNAYSNHLFKMASINTGSSLEDSIFPSGHLSARMRASEKAPCLLYLICSSGLSIVLSTFATALKPLLGIYKDTGLATCTLNGLSDSEGVEVGWVTRLPQTGPQIASLGSVQSTSAATT